MAKPETRDEFIKGVTAGSIGAAALYIVVQTFYWLGLIKYGQNILAADVVFNWQPTLLMAFIGFAESIVIGAFFGIPLAFLFSRWLTSHYYLLKGLLYGLALWVFNLGIMDELFKYPRDMHARPLNLIVFLLGYSIYGIITAFVLKRLGIFKPVKV
ncbi:MAG: hypothetical protein ACOY4Q_01705 [Bacillota bacterium]